MLAILTRLLVFALAIVTLLELSLRVYYFGADAFSPAKMNSHTVIMDSGLVQAAANTDIYFELKPNIDALHAGQPLQTNSAGLPDREYAVVKPANTYRVAVVGSSWSMATGVAPEESYQALLEEQLQSAFPDRNNEVINFAVEFYGLSEITATARDKAVRYDPDLLLIAITSMTPVIRWQDEKPPFTTIEITPPFWQSMLYSMLMGTFGKQPYAKSSRPLVNPIRGAYSLNIKRSMAEIGELLAGTNTQGAVLWLTHTRENQQAADQTRKQVEANGFAFIPLHMEALADEANAKGNPLIGRIGRHPSALGHELIAAKVFTTLWGQP